MSRRGAYPSKPHKTVDRLRGAQSVDGMAPVPADELRIIEGVEVMRLVDQERSTMLRMRASIVRMKAGILDVVHMDRCGESTASKVEYRVGESRREF